MMLSCEHVSGASDYYYFFPNCTDKRTTKPHEGTVFYMSFSDHMSMYAYATGMIPSGIGLSPCFSRCHTMPKVYQFLNRDGRTNGPHMPHLSLHLCQYFCYTTYAAKITCLSFRICMASAITISCLKLVCACFPLCASSSP